MGLAVGPFGVADAIAAIHEAEHRETCSEGKSGETRGRVAYLREHKNAAAARLPPCRAIHGPPF